MSTITALRSLRGRTVLAGASALSTAVVLGAALLAASPAEAAPPTPYGTVTAGNGLVQRQYPSTDSSAEGSLRYRQQVGLRCKVRAQNIEGNTIWYLLRDTSTWVSAKYVDNTGNVAYCKDVQRRSPATMNAVPKGAKG
ncbi:SH3 domain-containing protein [Streptomyces sp. NBC_00859]|uniref:SH3 domain-containing protein n=1 Tax=Streptomyces sp. NBC_00859 TaxID=2903682 RepID=UPI003870803A|nr:SH3 domain-containing protein [Streptomyces sp. NBC_00859]